MTAAGDRPDLTDGSDLTDLVRTAHGDAWQVQGTLRAGVGGGSAELPGIRLMASGIAAPQWNNGDVTDPAAVDLDAVRAFYREHGDVPWGVRVPAGRPWAAGRHLFAKRCMGLPAERFRPATHVAGLELRPAGLEELDLAVDVDLAVFGGARDLTRRWLEPMVHPGPCRTLLAFLEGRPAGLATSTRSSGRAGECVYVTGVGVLEAGTGPALTCALVGALAGAAFAEGATLAHLNPGSDAEARALAGLGFVETGGFDVYTDL